jgi:molybdopterin synthase sulfur carrier subunit
VSSDGTAQRDLATHAGDPARVTVRYWAAARQAAGVEEDHVAARTVGEALAHVRAIHAHQPRFEAVLGVSSLLLGSSPVGLRDVDQLAVPPGEVVEVLPPFAGG